MRRRVTSVVTSLMLICFLLVQVAQAAESRAVKTSVDLSFEGTTAICSAVCIGNSSSDKVEATLALYQGSILIDSWSNSGSWSIALSGEHKVTSGKTYRLELTYSINGVSKPDVSTTNLFAPVELDEVLESEDALEISAAAEIATLQVNEENAVSPCASVTYYRLKARNYALSHATDAPEFNSSNGGSDCANFVSKALNYGGFPTDSSNQWYPASTYGSTATCGTNWMRTGYYGNGGVVPYMVNTKGYFAQTTASAANAGCIMYWTNTSHVALVTYGDTATVKYTQHSNKTLSSTASTNVVYDSSEVSAYFYKPTSLVTVSEVE